ncbi:hypothetical protein HMF8227_01832 [Saliniradius amylolyticus]|uniref:Copper resistance protein D n=1 Tax=Saliniradius amylolyticus TaxID=2183582 RepID=A0A2S2E3T6_9ALTE|nr:CopD family protein [Saliniradius amylolyticus]AWL12305.1 hypothetical protein HMF8227_01832 [Saliniradius amylolyticus]
MNQASFWWPAAAVLCQWLFYLSLVACVGGALSGHLLVKWSPRQSLYQRRCRHYVLTAVAIGLLAVVSGFFIQVGLMAGEGIVGMTNPMMRQIVWSSNVGEASLLRGMGLLALLVAFVGPLVTRIWWLRTGIWLVGVVALSYSLTLLGHLVNAPLWLKGALLSHFLVAAWWLGSLIPLMMACRTRPLNELKRQMVRFGQYASGFMFILVAAGAVMAWSLLDLPQALWRTSYGLTLTVKLMLLMAMLMLAARHKWHLVPALSDEADSERLRRSIFLETLLAALLLLATAVLTTVVGPNS